MSNITKHIGPAVLVFDPLGTPVTFDSTMGGAKVEYSQEFAEVKEDGFGDAAIDMVSKAGKNPVVTAAFSQMDSARLAQFFGVTLNTSQHRIMADVGTELSASAKPLYIKPMVNGVASGTKADWVYLPKCTKPTFNLSLTYDANGQRVYNAKFYGLPGTASGEERLLISIGENV